MIATLAAALSAIVFAIAALHAYWGLGGIRPAESAEQLARTVVGRRGITRMPGRLACFLVAALLAGLAAWPLFYAGLVAEPWSRRLTIIAGPLIAGGLVGRGIAGYRTGWREHFSEQPFASLDRRLYSPLCLLLGAGYFVVFLASNPMPSP